MSILRSCSVTTRISSISGPSGFVLVPIREGADFTLYRGRQRGNPSPVLAIALSAEQPSPQTVQITMKGPSLNRSGVVDRPSSRDSRSRTILIVDDSDTVRGSVPAVLESQTGWQVCGEATDGVDAIRKARKGRTMKLPRIELVF